MTEINIQYYKANDLIMAEYNPRQLTKDQYTQLKDSLTRFGLVDPLIVNKHKTRKNILVGGHQRLRIAKEMGLDNIPCVEVDLPYDKERELNIRLNKNVGEWDYDSLANHFDVGELTEWGFSDDELQFWTDEPTEGLIDDDEIPEVEEAITKQGDMWILGDHRLLCGDATKKEDVERLMDGSKADLTLTDPPYGIELKYSQFNDTLDEVIKISKKWLPIARSISNVVVFSPGVTRQWIYPEPSWVMCWFYKGGQNRSPWGFNCWQPVLCYGKDPSLANGKGCRPDAVEMNITPNLDIDHPCPKPMALWDWLIERLCFNKNEKIYDPFLGSGSTLIACEKTNRKCYGMEIDPHYCDVIVKRWEEFTGNKAERVERVEG